MTTFTDRHRSDFNYANIRPSPGSFGDIVWRDQAGDNVLWFMIENSPSFVGTLPTVTPDWHVKAVAYFGGFPFGNADILWQNDNGALALWQMTNATVTAIQALPNPGPTWHMVGDNDFNRDATDDILFQNDNGTLAIWTDVIDLFGIFAGTQNPGPSWHVVATGDVDGDNKAGILWQNDNGALVLWEDAFFPAGTGTFTFNTVFTPLTPPTVDPSWHVKGMPDVNGDGRSDIVFQHDSGAVVIWEMGNDAFGIKINAINLVDLNPGPAWHIVGLRDMNNDAHADILWQNDNGVTVLWEDYQSHGGGSATYNTVALIDPNPNPNGGVWDLL